MVANSVSCSRTFQLMEGLEIKLSIFQMECFYVKKTKAIILEHFMNEKKS